jgi:hypothetical protein
LTFGFALSYIVIVETKRLTEAQIVACFAEWCKRIWGLLSCPEFKGVVVVKLHVNVAAGEVHISSEIEPH